MSSDVPLVVRDGVTNTYVLVMQGKGGESVVRPLNTDDQATAYARAAEAHKEILERDTVLRRPSLGEFYYIYLDARDRIPQKNIANYATAKRSVTRSRHVFKELGIDCSTEDVSAFGRKFNGVPLPKHYIYTGGERRTTRTNNVRVARKLFTKVMIAYYEEQGIDTSFFDCWRTLQLESPTIKRFTPVQGLEERMVAACEGLKDEDPEFYKAYLLSYGFGLRASEVRRAKYGDLYERNGGCIIRVWKPKSIRGATGEDFQERPVQKEWFDRVMAFKTTDEDRIVSCGKKKLERRFPKFLRERAGITDERPVHYLRKFAGDRILRTNDIWVTQMALGHSSIDITSKIYVSLPQVK